MLFMFSYCNVELVHPGIRGELTDNSRQDFTASMTERSYADAEKSPVSYPKLSAMFVSGRTNLQINARGLSELALFQLESFKNTPGSLIAVISCLKVKTHSIIKVITIRADK